MSLKDRAPFRDSLPPAPTFTATYTPEIIIAESEKASALIATIPTKRERAAKVLEYIGYISPALGAIVGPQGAALGLLVSQASAWGSRQLTDPSAGSPQDMAELARIIADIIEQIRSYQRASAPDPGGERSNVTSNRG